MSSKEEKEKTRDLPPRQFQIKQHPKWGKDHPTIGVPVPKINMEQRFLTIEGEVEKPLKLAWNEFIKLPMTISISDFHCVEGWSVLNNKWEGVRFKDLIAIAKPKKTAKYVTFECADGYTTSLSIKEISEDNVLLAIKLDGKNLEKETGAPLRLVVPTKYAYKSAMWITKIKFTSKKEMGYWESRGYSDTADVWKNDRFSK